MKHAGTPSYISYYTPPASRDLTPETVGTAPFMSFSVSLDRPWEYFVAQMILNQNVDFTIRIEHGKSSDPLPHAAQVSPDGSVLEKLFMNCPETPVGTTTLGLPLVPPLVIEPSLLSTLEDESLTHGIPRLALYHLALIVRNFPTLPPDSPFEMNLLTSRMKQALNLNGPQSETESAIDLPKLRNETEMLEAIRDLPSIYRATELKSQVDLICLNFKTVKAQIRRLPSSETKLSVIRRDLWQMVRLLLRSCESNSYALDQDLQMLRKLSNTLCQNYHLAFKTDHAWLDDQFKSVDHILESSKFENFEMTKSVSGMVFCVSVLQNLMCQVIC